MLTPVTIIKSLLEFEVVFPKRYKFLAVSSGFFILLVFFIISYSDYDIVREGIVAELTLYSLFSLILFIYPIVRQVRVNNLIRFTPVPVGYLFSSYLLLAYFPNLNIFFKFSFALFSAFVFYYLVLATNIFLVVEEKGRTIPLVRAAKTVFLFIEVITLFFVFTTIYKTLLPGALMEITFMWQSFMIFILVYLFAGQYWWSQNLEKEITSFVGNESLVIALLGSVLSLSLSFFPLESFFKALILATFYYVSVTFFQAVIMHRLEKSIYTEFLLITLVIISFVLIS